MLADPRFVIGTSADDHRVHGYTCSCGQDVENAYLHIGERVLDALDTGDWSLRAADEPGPHHLDAARRELRCLLRQHLMLAECLDEGADPLTLRVHVESIGTCARELQRYLNGGGNPPQPRSQEPDA